MDKIVSTAVTVDKAKDKFNNSYATAIERKERSNQHAEAEAADPHGMLPLKKKLRGLSYGDKGQDPAKLFALYDKDNSGKVTVDETMHMLYARYGKARLESQMKALFGEDLKTADGDGELSFNEYLKAVNIRLPKKKKGKGGK